MWIDQCCINQSDDLEKGKQVQLMGDIYKKAERTTIWLGESDETVPRVQELMQALSDPDSSDARHGAGDDIAAMEHVVGVESSRDDASLRRIEALTKFLNRDWFTRAWVFQEAVLAKDLCVRCGGVEFSFSLLKRVADAVCDIQYGTGGYARSLASTTVGFDMIDLIQHSRGDCRHDGCNIAGTTNFLGLLLKVLAQCRATNPRDLIYAFLAFQDPASECDIRANYTSSVETVWTDAAISIIKNSQSLDLFCAASGGRRPRLPSWVPDWSTCYSFGRPFAAPDMESAFCSGGATQHWQETELSENGARRLIVKGRIIDHIDWFSSWNSETDYYRDVSIQEFIALDRHVESLRRYLRIHHGLSADEVAKRWPVLEEAVMRTLLADGAFGSGRSLPSMAEILSLYRHDSDTKKLDASEELHNDGLAEVLQESVLILQKKRLFVSKNLLLGLAPRDASRNGAAVGNSIAILEGSRVPCLMRQAEGQAGTYKLIGQCYVDGWMYGVPDADETAATRTAFVLV